MYVGPMGVIHGLESGGNMGLSVDSIRVWVCHGIRLLGGAKLGHTYKTHPSPSLKLHVELKV